jgi:polyhydroxyalkanoate synthesis regulator phasin
VKRTRWLPIAATALAVVLGGGAALAATGSSNPASGFLGDVAKRLGISEDKLEDAIQDATIARIDAAIAAGDITKAEGDALKRRVRSGDVPPILRGLDGPSIERGPLGAHGKLWPVGTDLLDTAADYLGTDEADVREALRDGKSLAELAKDKGKSVGELTQALRDAIRSDADEAVEDGELTKEQADRLVDRLSDAVDELVEMPGGPALGLRGPAIGVAPPGPLGKDLLPGFLPGSELMETAADYLGMDEADVREALRDGKSLADLAKDKAKSVDGLEQALLDAIREDADQAVEDGVLTKEQADRLVGKLRTLVDKLVDGFTFDFRGGGGSFEFHFRVEPGDHMPPRDGGSSSEPPIVPWQPS